MTIIDTQNPSADSSKKHQMWTKVKDFLNYTTAHGCGRIIASKGIFWRVFWITLCTAAHAAFLTQTYIIIEEYLEKPIRTRISLQHSRKLDFPMVTICNRNSLRKSMLHEGVRDELRMAFEKIQMKPKSAKLNVSSNFDEIFPPPVSSHSSRARLDALREVFSKFDFKTLRESGHQIEDMVIDCYFNSRDCSDFEDKNIWRSFWVEQVGNCHMFNPAVITDQRTKAERAYLQSSLSGDLHGLTLILNIEQHEYLDEASPYAGLKVVIGRQKEMPFPLNQGINVAPGLATSIEIKKNLALRLDPFQNKSCETATELEKDNIYNDLEMGYSRMACKHSCLVKMETSFCECSQYRANDKISFCDFDNETVVECFNEVYEKFLNGSCESACPPPCSEEFFTTSISSSQWPANNYEENLIESMLQDYELNMTAKQIHENLIELRVYYAELDFITVKETLKYGLSDLLSNIGGQMGMWIGLSALTIGEVIEMTCMLVNCLFSKTTNNKVVVVNN